MADHIDRANEQSDFILEKSLQLMQGRFSKPSNTHCEMCEIQIPEQRRSIGGVKYCVDCQTYLERKGLV